MIDRDAALEIQRTALAEWIGALAESSPGSMRFERDGITACALPVCPERSIANSVTYADPAALLGRLDDLATFYDDAGIEAWTVWVPEVEPGTAAALERAGHAFDGQPMAMTLELADWQPPDVGDLDWDSDASPADLGRLNDLAYGLSEEEGLARALVDTPERWHLHQARIDGEVACVLGTIEHRGSDLGIYFVATAPEFRRRGLCSRLMGVVLDQGRQRGLATSSLQASPMGEPIYSRLGYRPAFRLAMYERRRPTAADASQGDPNGT